MADVRGNGELGVQDDHPVDKYAQSRRYRKYRKYGRYAQSRRYRKYRKYGRYV